MIPVINKKETGINIRLIMDRHNLTVKDIQKHLGLNSLQSIYHWLNGICLPTVDNLYALSDLFNTPVDELLRGSRNPSALCKSATATQVHPSIKDSFYGIWWQHIPLSELGLHRAKTYKQ